MLQRHEVFNTSVDKFVEKFRRCAPNRTPFNILLLFAQLLCKSSSGQREISASTLAATSRLQPLEIVAHPTGIDCKQVIASDQKQSCSKAKKVSTTWAAGRDGL
jgi:hypothetical protein